MFLMENIIKKGTQEYRIAHEKLEGILEEIDRISTNLFETKEKSYAKLLFGYFDNYKF